MSVEGAVQHLQYRYQDYTARGLFGITTGSP